MNPAQPTYATPPSCLDAHIERDAIARGLVESPVFPENRRVPAPTPIGWTANALIATGRNAPPPRLIGVCGDIGAGKDTFYNFLAHAGFDVASVSLAGPLKDGVCAILGGGGWFAREQKENPIAGFEGAPCGPVTPRVLAQVIGAAVRNQVHPAFWTGRALRAAEDLMAGNPTLTAVIPDVRYPDEAAVIRQHGGVIVRVVRPRNPYYVETAHESESHKLVGDYEIVNDGTYGFRLDVAQLARESLRLPLRTPYSAR